MEIMCFGCTLYCLWSAMASCFSCGSVTVNLNKTSWIMYCVQCLFASRSYFGKRWPAGFYSRILFLMEKPKNDSERSENYYYSCRMLEVLFCSGTRILHCSRFMHCKMDFGESRPQFFMGYKQMIFWTITDDTEKHSVEYTDRYTKE